MTVLILTNHQLGLYKFRRELIEKLVSSDFEVVISAPDDGHSGELEKTGAKVIRNDKLNRRGTNPISDLKLYTYYRTLLKKIRPDVVLTYTIKPNVYGGMNCGRMGIPYVANVTGLGTSIENPGILQKITLFLYRLGLKNANMVFFQNSENRKFMVSHKVVHESGSGLLPGSGVNTEQHCQEPYPDETGGIIFTTIGRIMKDKGIDELSDAATVIRERHPEVHFRLIGEFDEEYEDRIKKLEERGILDYLGFQKDVHEFIKESHAIIHASYHEGMSNVLLEAASTGRPVIATNVPGCIETFDNGVSGISFSPRDTDSLVDAIEKFLEMDHSEKQAMGEAGRHKIENEFSRNIVVNAYMDEIIRAVHHKQI